MTLFRDPDLSEAELVATGGLNHPSERPGEQLRAQTYSDDTHSLVGSLSKIFHLMLKSRQYVVCGHRSSKRDDNVTPPGTWRVERLEGRSG